MLCHQEEGNKYYSYCEWLDKEKVNGWPKRALLEARDETQEKKKEIIELIVFVNFLRMELEQQKVGKLGCSNGDEENKRLDQFYINLGQVGQFRTNQTTNHTVLPSLTSMWLTN